MRRRRSRLQGERADAALLTRRLEELGLQGITDIELHVNRTVLVTVTEHGVLRVHRGYAYASDRVLRALVRFVSPMTPRARRNDARRVIVEFPVEQYVTLQPRMRGTTGGRRFLSKLRQMHAELNQRHFAGQLKTVPIRVSTRMRTRLGEVTVDATTGEPLEIAISRAHIERDGWNEVRHTMLHEMVHQWQVETGRPLDHGKEFRAKAVAIGIEPRAMRDVRPVQPAMLEGEGG